MNDGTVAPDDIWTNVTKVSGNAFETLPPEPQRVGYVFDGWYPEKDGGERIVESSQVGASQILYAHWKDDEEHQLVKPVAVKGLVYDGNVQTGVVAVSTNYVMSGVNVATNAGYYTAVATLKPGFIWKGGDTAPVQIDWSIAKAKYDMSGVTFSDASYEADGTAKSLAISGTLPTGVTVSYVNNGKYSPGKYVVTAKFACDTVNHEPISDMTATLTIMTPVVPLTEVAVPVAVGGLVFDGTAKKGVKEGDGYTLEKNVATNAGSYTAEATLEGGYCWRGGETNPTQIVWKISKATYDMSGVAFTNATYVADGAAKSIYVSGKLPTGVTVSYTNNGKKDPGTYTVTAKFSGDLLNHEPIPSKTAKLTIVDKTNPPGPQPPGPGTPTEIDVPSAVAGLVYDGSEKTGVAAGAGYTLSGNVATKAGDYVAVATLKDGYCWKGGDTGAAEVAWKIEKGAYDMSGIAFESATYAADGTAKSLEIAGDLPEGVTVSYLNNGKTEPGVYMVTAKFSGDAANYEPIADMVATLTIEEAAEPEPELYPEGSTLTPFVGNTTYIGWLTRDGAVAGLVSIKAAKPNRKTNVATVTVTATPAGAKKWTGKLPVEADAIRDVKSDAATLTLSAEYVTGKIVVNGVEYGVTAGADFFKSKDKAVKADAKAKVPSGDMTFGFTASSGAFTVGSASVAKSTGKAKFVIYLADGTKVSVSSQGVYGYGMDRLAVPVSYAKKDISIGFVLWVGGGAARISGLTEKGAEIVQPELVRLPYGEYVFEHEALPSPYLGGEYSVDGLVFATAGVKWTFAKNVASLKLKCAKTGVVTGSFKMFYSTGAAKPKSDTAKFTGMLIGEKVFGTAVVKKKSVYLSAGASPRK